MERADAGKEHMGLTTWENAPDGKIVKSDVSIAKNYLNGVELEDNWSTPFWIWPREWQTGIFR